MDNSSNVICPFCKTPITDNEETVKCSQCGMPHHKDCWIANQGCTTFGCLGTIDNSDADMQKQNDAESDFEITFDGEIIIGNRECPVCATLNKTENRFCFRCGNKLKQ